MKNIKYSIIALSIIIVSISANSCSDSLLEEKLYDRLGASGLPSGAEGANQLVLGIYPNLQTNRLHQFLIYASDAESDLLWTNWGGTDPKGGWGDQMHFHTLDLNHSAVSGVWTPCYQIIAQCNEVIRLFAEEAKTDANVNAIMAEALFWRAWSYNWLMKVFGDVPLVKGGEDMSNGLARTSKAEILEFILSDLKNAETLLPSSRPASEYGRSTRWAAKTLLANIYLNQKDWANASQYAKDVIDNGGFELMDYYHDVFGIDENREVIQVSVCVGEYYRGNNFDALSLESGLVRALKITGYSASNGFGMIVPFFNSFDPADKRREDFNPDTQKGIMIHGYITDTNGEPLYKNAAGDPITAEEALYRVVAMKYPIELNPVRGEWMTADYVIMRLAEVYLTYAEAQNELGNSGEALTYINRIRKRAGLEGLSASLAKEQIRDAILDERGWELYFEGYRRDDLIRHGKLMEKARTVWEYYLDEPWTYQNDTFRNLFPIPASAMIRNPLLVQNPGY
ncbi:MAG: RagB/SusD family nutrient uptake outer membrane protein [Dysgonamonadaceae bacterium]|jgi:hypothetical protein|nr:RagB/SusD family nutrient uptake outer membrane protein [Dysgonamonadaceae bacterium]